MANLQVPKTLPEWFVLLAKGSRLSSKEVIKLFGFSYVNVLSMYVSRGEFPHADVGRIHAPKLEIDYRNQGAKQKNYWTKNSILLEIKRRKALLSQQEGSKDAQHS